MKRFLALLVTAVPAVVLAAPAWAAAGTTAGEAVESWLVVLAAGAAGFSMFLLVVVLFGRSSSRPAELQKRLSSYSREGQGPAGVFGRIRFLRRAARTAEGVAQERGALQMIETALEQANVPIRPGEAIIGAIGLAIVAGVVASALARSALAGLGAGVAVLFLAATAVNVVAARERKKFANQLPDTLTLIATSLRAGYSLLQAVEAVAQEAPEPTAREFGRAMAEIRLGRSVNDALDDVATRMESQDFEWAVLAIAIQREVGGNLAEVLQTTAETMLQRNRLRREMKALTAEGRISAVVLSGLPFLLFVVIWLVNPTYIQPLISTVKGYMALGAAGALLVAGVIWLQRIVKIEV